jgi:hypothetical protein
MTALLSHTVSELDLLIAQTRQRGDLVPEIAGNPAKIG